MLLRVTINNAMSRALVLLGSLALGSGALAQSGRLTITGSSTVAPLVLEMAKRYESLHPGVRIDVQTGGSSRGIFDVRSGLADLGMVSRAIGEAEQDIQAHLIAMDGIGIILHRSNPVARLTRQQIIDIYRGDTGNWSELGGPDGMISVVHKAEGRSTLEVFLEYFELRNSEIRPSVVIGDNQQGIKTVAGNPGAIGYVSIGAAEYEESRGTAIKLLPMAGVPATVEQVADGRYPLSRQLNLVSAGQPAGLAQSFVDFAQSDQVRDLIEAQFFVVP